MQKTILYILLLAILGAGVYYFVIRDNENVFGEKEAGFSVKDTASISRIFLVRNDGHSIDLRRTDSGWYVNNQFRARENTLKNLMWTLRNQFVQYPVPEQAHNTAIKNLATFSVKVEVYDNKGQKVRNFFVGNESRDYTGSYMLVEGASRPYVVQVPGVQGFPTPFYTTDIADWRDRTVFRAPREQIRHIAVKYDEEPLNSFTIDQNGATRLNTEPGIQGSNQLNEKRLNTYLGFYEEIYCEGYITNVPGMDSVLASTDKYCTISVVTKDNHEQQVDIYYMPINRRSKNLGTNMEGDYDIDRYYGVMNNKKDTVLLQHASFEPLFRKAWEFYQADGVVEGMQAD